ncbi:MAG: LacI family transcriptional regulator [Clostridiales bacterium]|nr:LacI family transcriptional regulator [Clostridiales bacterium]
MATIYEIAKLAGVSPTTVSYVINGTKKLRPETVKKVNEAIEKLQYSPNTVAQTLRKGKTTTIGVITEDIRIFPTPEILNGISEGLEKAKYQMLVHDLHLYEKIWPDYDNIVKYKNKINKGVNLLQQSMVTGIIYVSMHDRKLGKLINKIDLPIVYAYSYPSEDNSYVTYDDYTSAKSMVEYLISLGHKNIGIICGYKDSFPTQTRLQGVLKALEEHNITIPEEYITYGDWEFKSGYEKANYLLALKKRPTAIFALNDIMASGCYSAITKANLRIPEDISVAGFDNRDVSRYLEPPLTTMGLPLKELGNEAVNMLFEKINSKKDVPLYTVLPCNIHIRESTATIK